MTRRDTQQSIASRLARAMQSSHISAEEQIAVTDKDANSPKLSHLHEQINCEAALLVQQQLGPGALISALQSLALHNLCAAAAEAHFAGTEKKTLEDTANQLAESSPLFIEKKWLFAAPVGALHTEALQRFSDRILSALQNSKIKKVTLQLTGLQCDPNTVENWTAPLREELAAQKIALDVSLKG